jgi:hypothetical protein
MSKKKITPTTALQSTISGPTAPVPKDPQPSVDRIDELARRILQGDILLPKFQRGLVWDKEQILTLLDSVARGYPIGSILLWQSRQELRSENRIAELNIELPRPDYPVNYLLDGQQRLSAICGAMFWNGDDPKSRWNIAYDLRTQTFSHLDSLEDPPQYQIRVNKLSDPTIFFKHVASLDTLTSADKDILKQSAEALFNRFKDYKLATVTLGDMAIQDVAPVFERINSTGTRLTIVDLMRAATWSPDFDLVDAIDGVLLAIQEKGFGEIDRRVVLRNISAAAGGGFSAESIDNLRNYEVEKLKDAITNTEEAYKRTVDFLSTEIGIDNANIIPYSNQITVLAEIFRRVPIPNAQQHRAIVEWFWKTSLSGYFSGWNTGMMTTDLSTIRNFAEGHKERLTFQPRRDEKPEVWVSRQFRTNNAHTKLFAIILAHYQPNDLLTGQKIDTSTALAWNNVKQFHHFFPQAFLKSKNEPTQKINCLANIIMLTTASNKVILNKAPSVYLKDVASAAGANLNEWLNSNVISEDAYEAGLKDDFDLFLRLRSEAIDLAVRKKIETD